MSPTESPANPASAAVASSESPALAPSLARTALKRLAAAFPDVTIRLLPNPGPSGQDALLLPSGSEEAHRQTLAIAAFLRDELGFDFASNVSGVDYPEVSGSEDPGYLEVVYHLYRVAQKQGTKATGQANGKATGQTAEPPLVLKLRTADRLAGTPGVEVPSLTPVWKSCEFQEREVFDLFGVRFAGHPDLRRLLMWDEFVDHPMRKDYAPPKEDLESLGTLQRGADNPVCPSTSLGAAHLPMGNGPSAARQQADKIVRPPLAARPTSISDSSLGTSLHLFGPQTETTLDISLGPQHPSTHGVFRMNVRVEGETVVALQPVFGYLHRNHEKLAERHGWLGSMPYTERLDYICPVTNNWAYAVAVERLAGIAVPERAEYIRVILGELTRLQNHTAFLGFMLGDLGGWGSALMYAFREREKILDLFEWLTGARMMVNYFRFGGVRRDLPEGWLEQARAYLATYPAFLDEMERFLVGNEILLARLQGLAVLSPERAIAGGLSGPILRASGVDYDLRKVDGYGVYPQLSFRVPRGTVGDCYDRFMLRILEARESLAILDQALARLPGGPIITPAYATAAKQRALKPAKGEAYGRIEAPKGELGFHLVSTGGEKPHRFRVRPPSLINLTLLEEMCVGAKIADVIVILGSIDIVLGEVDR